MNLFVVSYISTRAKHYKEFHNFIGGLLKFTFESTKWMTLYNIFLYFILFFLGNIEYNVNVF